MVAEETVQTHAGMKVVIPASAGDDVIAVLLIVEVQDVVADTAQDLVDPRPPR